MEERKPKIGEPVVYVDPHAVQHAALVTQVWGPKCINVVIVSGDVKKEDTFGRQIERHTSLVHSTLQQAHGNYFRWPEEAPKETEVTA